jgi:hypothetical protein
MGPKNKVANNKETLLTITVGFLVLFLVFELRWMLFTSLAVGLVALFSPFMSRYIALTWSKLASILGYFMPNILLGMLYVIFLIPIAILSRIGKHNDPLQLRIPKDSTFANRTKNYNHDEFEKIW